MHAVIIRASVGTLDEDYRETIQRMKELAFDRYGCIEFVALMDGDQRIAISYWESEAQIARWKMDAEHLLAQRKAREKWYRTYKVQVVEVKREYGSEGEP